jgi:hypothetical protein
MMNSQSHPRLLLVSMIGVLLIASLFYTLAGHRDRASWPANSVQNWNQYGFGALHGKLVTNPGGFEVLTAPVIYKGHRAASFYPVFAVGQVLGWAGNSVLIFHLIFSVVLFFSVWLLLGQSNWALVGAAAAILSPGYSVYPTVVDPNSMALYMTVPFAAIAIRILSENSMSAFRFALLALATFAYTSLNWTTAFGHGILFCTLLVLPAVKWSRLGIYAGMAAVSVGIVGCLSMLDKMSGGASGGGNNFQTFLAGYTWGHTGYGVDLTTGKAIVRLSTVNGLSLLPLLAFTAYLTIKVRNLNRRFDPMVFLPLLAAGGGVMFMRNYFGHHPWMAAPMLLPGLALSLAVVFKRNATVTIGGKKIILAGLFLTGSFFYAVVLLGANRVYHADELELTSLVYHHSQRADTIVLVTNLDPQMAEQVQTLAYTCDRHFVVMSDLNAPLPAGENLLVLSATDLSSRLTVTARSEKSALLALPGIHELKAWYAQKIARRGAQDHHFDYTVGASFGLYRLPPPAR